MYNLRIISRENKLVLRKSKTSVRILKKTQKKVNIQARAKRGLKGDPGDPATNLVQSVNGKQGVVVLNSVDVGADAAGAAAQALSDAKDYTDIAVSNVDTGVVSVQAGANVSVDNTDPKNPVISSTGGGGGGAVDSVNGQTGVVVLDSDDIDEGSTNLYLTPSERTKLGNTSGTNTGDQDLSGYALISSLADVATSGDYADLDNKPMIPGSLGDLSGTSDDVTEGSANLYMTSLERSKLSGIEAGAEVNTVNSVNTQTGTVVLDADDIDDTSTTHKFATSTQLNNADSAIQPGDNISELTNDSGFTSNTGTVTSVGITGTDGIEVDSGSPITTSGSIQLGLSATVQGQLSDASTAVQPAQIADFETTTELNARDTANRARANHTGTQAISTVSGLQDALNAKLDSSTVAADGMGVAVHGTNASLTRPTGFAQVTWIGTVEPDNATTNDIWYNG